MQRLNNLTNDADQLVTFQLPDGSLAQMEFIYRSGTQRWALNLNHPLLTLNGYNLVVSPNILRQWKNLVPFGIAILSTTGLDPMNPNDLVDGTILVEMLDASEVALVESTFMTPAPVES